MRSNEELKKADPFQVLKSIIPNDATKPKVCKCGEQYFGNYPICPLCNDKEEKLKQSLLKKDTIKKSLKSSLFDKLKKGG